MLVIEKMDIDLRKYLQQNHNQLTWKVRIKITFIIISELYYIHNLMIFGVLVILDFVDLLINHQKVCMEIFLI